MSRVFLCHASEDKGKVIEVYRQLKTAGLDPWLDKIDLLPGQNWTEEIPKVLRTSSFVLVFLSNNSISKRGYVQKEFKLALEVLDEIPPDNIFIIPIRLDDCEIPYQFRALHYVDYFEQGALEKVLDSIKGRGEPGVVVNSTKTLFFQGINKERFLDIATAVYVYYQHHGLSLIPSSLETSNYFSSGCYIISHSNFIRNKSSLEWALYRISLCLDPSLPNIYGGHYDLQLAGHNHGLGEGISIYFLAKFSAQQDGADVLKSRILADIGSDQGNHNFYAIVAPPQRPISPYLVNNLNEHGIELFPITKLL